MTLLVLMVLWVALGWWREWPASKIWAGVIALWLLAVLLAMPNALNPDPMMGQGSDDLRGLLALGFLAGFGAIYSLILQRVRKEARAVQGGAGSQETAEKVGLFSTGELERYARHIILREIGGPGQRRLKEARVLVVGAGGLGSPALLYLAASGVGTIGVIDDDVVDTSNLQRQVIHTDDRVGMDKVRSAAEVMQALNPFVQVRPYKRRLTTEIAAELFADYDLILDGSDNFDTRYLVNTAAVVMRKPLIAGAITQWEGQISLYDPAHGGPCYACLFPNRPAPGMVPTCAEAGVASPLPGVIGSMMAVEAVKQITGAGEGLLGRLMIYDALYGESRVIAAKRRTDCMVCGDHASHV